MIEFISRTSAGIHKTVGEFRKGRNIVLSNYFGVGDGDYGIYESANTLLIRKRESGFYRTYLLSSDINELRSLFSALESNKYVFNIPSKKGIDDWEDIFQKAGFTNIGVYK